jgi:hypothetical protein
MFEAISDHRIFGIDFTAYKDQVRIVAACNLGIDYSGAQGVDAALSARFSIYWKKEYDIKDVNSYKAFLRKEESKGEIDGLIPDYLDSLSDSQVLEFIKKVETRTIEKAEPSTRMLYQLSKDIKNMRGSKSGLTGEFQKSVFNGGMLFSASAKGELFKFNDNLNKPSTDINDSVAQARNIIKYIKGNYKRWEGYLNKTQTMFNGKMVDAEDLIVILARMDELMSTGMNTIDMEKLKQILIFTQGALTAIKSIEDGVEDNRRSLLQSYAGVDFTSGFLPYFNERFGKANDIIITIEMLNDENLIGEFFNQQAVKMGKQTDLKIEYILELINQFWDYWGDKGISPLCCADFYMSAVSNLDTNDNVIMLQRKMGVQQDAFMTKAEEFGDQFILDALSIYPGKVSSIDIAALRAKMTTSGTGISKKAKLL